MEYSDIKFKKDYNTYNVMANGKKIGTVAKRSQGRFGSYWECKMNGQRRCGETRKSATEYALSTCTD